MRAVRTLFSTVQQARTESSPSKSTMSDGHHMKGQTLKEAPTKLALAELRSVQWVQGQQTAMSVYQAIAQRYAYLKQILVVGWFIVIMEVIAVWWWTFLHNVSWPQGLLNIIARMDSLTVDVLEAVQQRLEWWWDVAGVRFMWLRESVEGFLDRNLTTIDNYFALMQDWILAVFNFFMIPLRTIGNTVSSSLTQSPGQNTTSISQKKNGSPRRNSEGYEAEDNEDWGEEDYLSDASMDSRRLMKEDSRGESYTRVHTTARAEGKFREAMYHRVRNELGIMRKNSITFSKGIVNCAKQMVGLNTRQYGESFLDFCQRWAKDLGLLDLILTIQEEMREQPFLAKPLVLVRVLSEAWLGFLLRLVKGKKSRRTRSMRSESLRRRVLNQSGTSNPLPLSPAALQQSSEPVQQPHLTVRPTLQVAALKEEEEDLEGFLSKDSALGSEDNRSETIDSDQTISHIDEGLESDSDLERHMSWNNTNSPREAQGTPLGDIQETQEITLISFTDGEKSSTLCTGSQTYRTLSSANPNSTTLLTGSRNSSPSTLRNSPVTFCDPDLLNQNSQLKKPKSTKPKRVTYR